VKVRATSLDDFFHQVFNHQFHCKIPQIGV
jgi:hypothetical protein